MSKAISPLLGYNNNVRHKNRVFHIQTEDSGLRHPHIITHLFMDGGRILKSVKRSYSEHIGADNVSELVRGMMKEQHKSMFIALRDGQFDPLIDAALGGGSSPDVNTAAEAQAPQPRRKTQRPPPGETKSRSVPPPSDNEPPTDREAVRVLSDLPPPPANLFAKPLPADTRHRSQSSTEEHLGSKPPRASRPPGARTSNRPPAGRPGSRRPSAAPPSDGRYAASRPASIFGAPRPSQASIFGEDLISDKSLDEVILSYLAEDLESETTKK